MSRPPSVGVVGVPGEPHAAFVLERLAARGVRPLFIRTSPEASAPQLVLEDGRARYGDVDLDGVPVFYLRTLYVGLLMREDEPDWYTEYAADRERQGAWVSWLRMAAARSLLVNPAEANELHRLKPYQLHLLRDAGVPVPATLVTSDPEALRRFWSRHREVIYKPVAGGALANLLREEDLTEDRLEALSLAPVLFQEYVPGRDLRVYTVGGEVVAAGVIHGNGVDYRAGEGRIDLVRPEPAAAELAVRAAAAAGCRFCAVDMKQAPDGRTVVLECNPSPMFLGFDRKAGACVGERLVDYLVAKAAEP
ncbi:MAG TPA: ATP-grasp domain-containing protein [Dehalococcoidia bacterium]